MNPLARTRHHRRPHWVASGFFWGVLVLAAGCVFVLLSLSGRKNGFRNWLALAVLSFALLCFY